MKASAASARNAVTSPFGLSHPPVVRTDSETADTGRKESGPPAAKKRVRTRAAKAATTAATKPAAAAKKPAPTKPPAAKPAAAAPKPAAAKTRLPAKATKPAKAPAPTQIKKPAAVVTAPESVAVPTPPAPPQETVIAASPAAPPEPPAAAPEAAAPVAEAAPPEATTPVIEPAEAPAVQDNGVPAAKPAEAKPEDAKIPEVRAAEARMVEPRPMNGMPGARPVMPVRAMAKQENFVEGDYVVYPTHGVGKVEKIAIEDIAGHRLELIHITFEENRMTLRVPVAKARTAGLRKLTSQAKFDEALTVLRGRARIKRTMWSRRAQEYEAKINSGDPVAIAEVVRDLHRNAGQPDQSFSERQIYESAMDRLAAEMAALDATDKMTAVVKLATFLKAA